MAPDPDERPDDQLGLEVDGDGGEDLPDFLRRLAGLVEAEQTAGRLVPGAAVELHLAQLGGHGERTWRAMASWYRDGRGEEARFDPPIPVQGAPELVRRWLADLPPGAPAIDEVRWALALSSQDRFGQDWPAVLREHDAAGLTGLSWLGGPARSPLDRWPRRADGRPLAHLVTVDLEDVEGWREDGWRFPGDGDDPVRLPTTGVLEVFHDLESRGDDAAEGPAGAWLVRWVPEPVPGLVEPPEDVGTPTDVLAVVHPLPTFSLPAAVDGLGRLGPFEGAEEAERQYREVWAYHRTGSLEGTDVPVSRLYGHPQEGRGAADRVLPRVLPLEEPGDAHVLVLEVEGWTALAGWFGDGGVVEVWARASDIRRGELGRAWCLLRLG
ncbi:DUF1963 domain-containing protein [Pseudokineococcus lusitanus]|uniref:Uncharacterized protein DUF1963 n=1 Tax=Pseudokineococcus lusitanus TaxID=763993 RepID=A0A3N1HM01_9ACTN|nr:DUF1963 domain-containing protein [Pseudokineococcus lusitanus]ROP43342.1 uncharacterized protein DUF1963 [Pseudokineococcus lusitanus]